MNRPPQGGIELLETPLKINAKKRSLDTNSAESADLPQYDSSPFVLY
jgi:hypothetical protein